MVAGAIVLLARDLRLALPALFLNQLALALFVNQQDFVSPDLTVAGIALSTTAVVKVITALAVTAILSVTALTFSREYNVHDLDEFSLAELRRAARRAQLRRAITPQRLTDLVVPFWSLLLALVVSLALPRLYPIGEFEVDVVWYWLGLTGALVIVTAADLLKIGLGLLMLVSAIDVLYTALAPTVQVFPLTMLALLNIVLAVMVSYLSGLMYGRLKTLDLSELYRRL